jgi:ankyrin repeat protein
MLLEQQKKRRLMMAQLLLLHAAGKGHKAIVELLLENGANADSKDDKGLTPLLRAAQNGHEAIVQLLKSIK